MELVVGKCMFDAQFRVRLLGDPEGTAASIGVALTTDQVESIKKLDAAEVASIAEDFRQLTEPPSPDWPFWQWRGAGGVVGGGIVGGGGVG
jgi:hypothetical protein